MKVVSQFTLTILTLFMLATNITNASDGRGCERFKPSQCNNFERPTSITLFMEMNGGPKEVRCAQKAACENGQVLLLFPPKELKQKIHSMQNKYHLPEGMMQKELQKFLTKKREELQLPVESMVISGHNGGSLFGSENGTISFADINQVFDELKMKDDLTSLFSWGCYTATLGEVDQKWAKHFPNLHFILGYDLKAPLSHRPGSYETLYEGMTATKDLLAAGPQSLDAEALAKKRNLSQQESNLTLQDMVHALTYENIMDIAGYYNPHNTLCAQNVSSYFGSVLTNKDAVSMDSALATCKRLKKQFDDEGLEQKILDYRSGSLPFDQAEIRRIYNIVRIIEACSSGMELSADNIILLIYDKYVYPTFFRIYGKDFERIVQSLMNYYNISEEEARQMVPSIDDYRNNPENYRQVISRKIHRLQEALNKVVAAVTLPVKCTDGSVSQYDDKDCVAASIANEQQFSERSGDLNYSNIGFATLAADMVLLESEASIIPTSWRDNPNSRDRLTILQDSDNLFFE